MAKPAAWMGLLRYGRQIRFPPLPPPDPKRSGKEVEYVRCCTPKRSLKDVDPRSYRDYALAG